MAAITLPIGTRYSWRAFRFWLTNYRRTWRGSLFGTMLQPLLFLLAIGYGLGTLVQRNGNGVLDGVPYSTFVATGLLAALAMQIGVMESTWTVLGAIRWQRQFLAMLATPLRVTDVIVGYLGIVALRPAVGGAFLLLVMAVLGMTTSPAAALALPAVVLIALAHATPVMAFTATQHNEVGFSLLFRFGVTPMFLFSGTFFPVSQLPVVLQPVAWATPLWHGVELCRGLVTGLISLPTATGHTAYLMLWMVVGYLVARRTFRRRLAV